MVGAPTAAVAMAAAMAAAAWVATRAAVVMAVVEGGGGGGLGGDGGDGGADGGGGEGGGGEGGGGTGGGDGGGDGGGGEGGGDGGGCGGAGGDGGSAGGGGGDGGGGVGGGGGSDGGAGGGEGGDSTVYFVAACPKAPAESPDAVQTAPSRQTEPTACASSCSTAREAAMHRGDNGGPPGKAVRYDCAASAWTCSAVAISAAAVAGWRRDARQRLGRRPRGGVVVVVRQRPRAVAPPSDPRSHRQLGVVLIETVASHQLHERAEGRGARRPPAPTAAPPPAAA